MTTGRCDASLLNGPVRRLDEKLTRKDSPNLESIPESEKLVLSMNYLDDVIYAPTAAMLYQFREVGIEGRATEVIDYDQPVFAWR